MAERLRSLVGKDGWDYCILWKIPPDKGSIQWVGCCCAGADQSPQVRGEEQLFHVLTPSTIGACRDATFHHPRSAACDSLAQVPSSIDLDSTSSIQAETLINNEPSWTFLSTSPNFVPLDENSKATQVLVPVPEGLVELFIAKHVPEDDRVIQFVLSQYSNSVTFLNYENEEAPKAFLACNNKNNAGLESHPWNMAPAATSSDQSNFAFSWDHPADPLRLSGSPLNLLSQPSCKDVYFDEGTAESILPGKVSHTPAGYAVHEGLPSVVAPVISEERDANEKHGSVKPEIIARRAESGYSDGSNQGEDDDDGRTRGGGGKKHQSKNLVAERRRRKKLNDRLYVLRSLVPNISKMDRASILGDAIEFVKKLENQVKQLQEELEKITPEEPEEHRQVASNDEDDNTNNNSGQMEILISGGPNHGAGLEDCKKMTGYSSVARTGAGELRKQQPQKNQSSNVDTGQHQMEIQVDVFQVNRNEFFVKVFCEHKIGGFLKLMEAINSLGLEVTNANVTTFNSLVLNVFKVEKRDNEVVEAEQVRQSLIDLTSSSAGEWTEQAAGQKPEYEDEGYYHRHYHGHNKFLHSNSQHNLHFIQHHL